MIYQIKLIQIEFKYIIYMVRKRMKMNYIFKFNLNKFNLTINLMNSKYHIIVFKNFKLFVMPRIQRFYGQQVHRGTILEWCCTPSGILFAHILWINFYQFFYSSVFVLFVLLLLCTHLGVLGYNHWTNAYGTSIIDLDYSIRCDYGCTFPLRI